MPVWSAVGAPRSDRPHAIVSDDGQRIEKPLAATDVPIDRAREQVLIRFPADSIESATAIFRTLMHQGIKGFQLYKVPVKGAMWRHRGGPHYLGTQGFRLRIPQVVTDRSKSNVELYGETQLLNQTCERYHKARKEGNVAMLSPPEAAQVKASLGEAKKYSDRLHALAAASLEMMNEAWDAFGFARPPREFWVSSIYDEPVEPPKQEPIPDPLVPDPEPVKPVEPVATPEPKHVSPQPQPRPKQAGAKP